MLARRALVAALSLFAMPASSSLAAAPGDLIVTEILYDPNAVFDSAGEWFEVYNATGAPIDMNGWRLQDNPSGNHLVNRVGGLLIPAGGRLVFGNNANIVTNGGVPVDYQFPGSGSGSLALANSGDFVRLVDPLGNIIDIVQYDRSVSGQFPNVSAGFSIALRDLGADNAVGTNWCAASTPFGAGDKGTPGQANDCPPPPELCGNGLDDDGDGQSDCGDADCSSFIDCLPRVIFTQAAPAGGYSAACAASGTQVPVQGSAGFGAIAISEIMANPAVVVDTSGEWLELVNRSSEPVDINGWRLSDDGGDAHVISNGGPLMIPAGGRIVIGINSDTMTNGGVTLAYQYAGFTLGNDDDEITLLDDLGRLVDRIVYDNGATFPDPNGKSLVMLDDALDNGVGFNWCVSDTAFGAGDLATPGAPNSCQAPSFAPGSVIVNEIMKNPNGVADDQGEWLELHNTTGVGIDIDGWTIRDEDFDLHVIDAGGPLVIPAGGFLVLGAQANPALNGGVFVDYQYVYAAFQLGNDDDEIVLLDLSLAEIDRVEYDNAVTFPDPAGGSMALVAPDRDRNDGHNWCVARTAYAAFDRGTPGAANDCGLSFPEAGLALSWTSDCPGAAFDDDGAASTVLSLDPDACVVDCTVTLTATDGISAGVSDASVRVEDLTAPALVAPADLVVEAPAPSTGPSSETGWLATATASDACSTATVSIVELSRVAGCGGTEVATFELRAVDACGNASAPQVVRYEVVDTTAPVIVPAASAPSCLWPPNHRMVTLDLAALGATASDSGGGASVVITRCESSEADDARGDGSTAEDCVVAAGGSAVELRAERAGGGAGRTYSVMGVAVDECGNASAEMMLGTAFVPHDRGCR